MPIPIHHLHKRKRIHQKKEKYPHPNKFKYYLDHLIYLVGVLAPLSGAVQSYKIWAYQNASGVSLFMFGSHIVFNIVWLIYGIIHKEKPIIAVYIGWILVNSLIVIGTILYG